MAINLVEWCISSPKKWRRYAGELYKLHDDRSVSVGYALLPEYPVFHIAKDDFLLFVGEVYTLRSISDHDNKTEYLKFWSLKSRCAFLVPTQWFNDRNFSLVNLGET